jgi:hypothetical protein
VNRIDGMLESVAAETLAVQQRRKGRRQEWNTHVELVSLMREHIASCVFWSSLDNAPRSMLGALHARRRGVRAGLPDLMVIVRGLPPFSWSSKVSAASQAMRSGKSPPHWWQPVVRMRCVEAREAHSQRCGGQEFPSKADGSRRGSSRRGKDRSTPPPRHGVCRSIPRWRAREESHSRDIGSVSARERPQSSGRSATKPVAMTSPHRVPRKRQRRRDAFESPSTIYAAQRGGPRPGGALRAGAEW